MNGGGKGERAERTGIELGAIRLQSSPVVDLDLVALLGLSFALDGEGDVNLQVISSEDANGGGGQDGQRQKEALHDYDCGGWSGACAA